MRRSGAQSSKKSKSADYKIVLFPIFSPPLCFLKFKTGGRGLSSCESRASPRLRRPVPTRGRKWATVQLKFFAVGPFSPEKNNKRTRFPNNNNWGPWGQERHIFFPLLRCSHVVLGGGLLISLLIKGGGSDWREVPPSPDVCLSPTIFGPKPPPDPNFPLQEAFWSDLEDNKPDLSFFFQSPQSSND